MRKKFTMLLALLSLVTGTAWAQTAITAVSDLSSASAYTIKTAERGYFYYDEANPNNLTSISHTTITNTEPDGTELQLFAFLRDESLPEGDYYIYSIAAKKFVTYTSGVAVQLNEEPVFTWTVVKNDDIFLIKIPNTTQTYINITNTANGAQYGCKVASTAPDGGNKLTIKSWTPTAEQAETITAAEAKIAAYLADQFDPTKLYRVYNKVDGDETDMAWSPNNDGSKGALVAYDANADNQLWRLIPGTGNNEGKYLIYNVATKKYLRGVTGNYGVELTATESDAAYYSMTKEDGKYKFNHSQAQNSYLFNDGGGRLYGWTDGSKELFTMEAVEKSVQITYTFKYGDETKHTQEESVLAGDLYPDYDFTFPYGVTADAQSGRVGLADEAIEVVMTESLPFQYAADYGSIKNWYYMNIHSTNKYYLFYEENDEAMAIKNESSIPSDKKDEYSWAFVGNPFDGYKIVNKAAGENKILSASTTMSGTEGGSTYPVLTDVTALDGKNTLWIPSAGSVTNGFFLEQKGYSSNKMNYRDPNLSFWTGGAGPGSTFQVVDRSRSVEDLATLDNMGIYVLQAERSPLMYSATEGMTTKLSSGLVDGVTSNANDVNQHFLIMSNSNTPDGLYYLYSVGAQKFVAADLTFADYPEPVLSFEAYTGTNSGIYPWWVKIGGKYVIPGNGATDGNKLFHVEGGDDDDGKRYRIVNAGTADQTLAINLALTIESAQNLLKSADELSNDKVYTVTTSERGSWYYNSEKDALWSTTKAGVKFDGSETQQFAFLTVSGKTFLYSVGAQKFVSLSEPVGDKQYTVYSESPVDAVELLAAEGDKFFPFVVSLAEHHMGINNEQEPPVITFWNDLADPGNKVRIEPAGTLAEDTKNTLLAKIEDFLVVSELVPELEALVAEAQALLDNNYYHNTEDAAALTTAKDAAQAVLDLDAPTSDQLTAQVESLTAAIAAATCVAEITDFKNAFVYTFVSKRGWMGATETEATVKSITGAADDVYSQWAVYKSSSNYYLYNIGKGQFMGLITTDGANIPFVTSLQLATITFKKSAWEDYPIMFSVDNAGAVNNDTRGNMIYWAGGWSNLTDEGNNHQVTIVGALDDETLNEIAAAVELYETQGVAIQALDAAIAAAQAKVDGIGEGLGYYSTTNANAETDLEAIKTFRAAITGTTTVADIEEQTAAAEAITATFTVNLPEAGKYYRLVSAATSNSRGTDVTMIANRNSGMVEWVEGTNLATIDNLWQFVAADGGKYKLMAANGGYLGAVAAGSQPTAIDNEGTTSYTLGIYNPGVWKIYRGNGASEHLWADGSNVICGWEAGPSSNSAWYIRPAETIEYTLSDVNGEGYASVYLPFDVTLDEGVTACAITNVENGKVTLTEKDDIAANQGALLFGAPGTYTFNIATASSNWSDNKLQGSNVVSYVEGLAYVLANVDNVAGLYRAKLNKGEDGSEGNSHFKNNANKAYLPVEESPETPAPAMFAFTRGDDAEDTTGIEQIAGDNAELVIYDLAGRRVAKMEKGIYIVNGRKVVK